MKKILLAVILCVSPLKADTLKVVTNEIERSSALTLRNDVGQDLAENLLAAQLPGVCSYCASEPDSLSLSIDAVLKALTLEKSFGLKYCDDSNCQLAWSQSTIAINDRVIITTSFAAAADPVATPEPKTMIQLAIGFAVLSLVFVLWPRKKYGR